MIAITPNQAREYRDALLLAFDKYKANVQYGLEVETPEIKTQMIQWYRSMLDLPLDKETYLASPDRIKYYLPKIHGGE